MWFAQRGISIKPTDQFRYDWAKQSVAGTLEKDVSLWFQRKEDNELFTSNFSALFIEAARGACFQRALAVQENCHGCCGLKIRAIPGLLAFFSVTGENLVYRCKAFGKIPQERRHCCLGLMTQTYSWGQPFLSSFHCGGPLTKLTSVSGYIRSLAFTR